MTEVITFPDAVAAVQDYLTSQLAGFTDAAVVVESIPHTRPTRMVRVVRTGGVRLDLIRDQAQLSIDCWDTRLDNAHDLAQVVRGLLGAMPYRYTTVNVYKVRELGFTQLVDPETALPFYRLTVLLDLRGAALQPL